MGEGEEGREGGSAVREGKHRGRNKRGRYTIRLFYGDNSTEEHTSSGCEMRMQMGTRQR